MILIRITLFILLLFSSTFLAAQITPNQSISLDCQNMALSEVLDSIVLKANVQFAYDQKHLPLKSRMSIRAQDELLTNVLSQICAQHQLNYTIVDRQISLTKDFFNQYTLSGYISDLSSGEELIGATIFDQSRLLGATANNYGFFSLTLDEGLYIIQSSYLGYHERYDTIQLWHDIKFDIELIRGEDLEEVLVVGKLSDLSAYEKQAKKFDDGEIRIDEADKIPSIYGSKDIMAILRLQPGVITGGNNHASLFVRGGELDQNLIQLDGVTLYGVNHFQNRISIFNGSIIQKATIHMDGMSAALGDRLSSLIDVRMKEGNHNQFGGGASIGILEGSAFIEGPIVKEKSSFIVAARRTWPDLIPIEFGRRSTFYDFNAKVNVEVSKRDQMYISYYQGRDLIRDKFDANIDTSQLKTLHSRVRWGNTAWAFRWRRALTPKLFCNFNVHHTKFDDASRTTDQILNPDNNLREVIQLTTTSIEEDRIVLNLEFHESPKHLLLFGGHVANRRIDPGTYERSTVTGETIQKESISADRRRSFETIFYAEDQMKLNYRTDLTVGLRFAWLHIKDQDYYRPLFRVNLRRHLSATTQIGLSYDETVQFVNFLNASANITDVDRWLPTTEIIRPKRGRQIAINFKAKSGEWYISTAMYYKRMINLLRTDGGDIDADDIENWEQQLLTGTGISYGSHISFNRSWKQGGFQASFNYSKSKRKFDELLNGQSFIYDYDKPLAIKLFGYYALPLKDTKTRRFGLTWTYTSGRPVTLPSSGYFNEDNEAVYQIDEINNYRLPDYHRLDYSYTNTKTTKKGNQRSWRFGVIDAYRRRENEFATINLNTETLKPEISILDARGPYYYVSYTFEFH